MGRLYRFFGDNRRGLSLALVAGIAVAGLLLYRLGSLTGTLSPDEQQLPPLKLGLHALWANPLNLPFKAAQAFVALILPYGGQTASRLPAALLAALTIGLLFWLLLRWYGKIPALYGLVLVMTSAWLLHVGRSALPTIGYPLLGTCLLAQYGVIMRLHARPVWSYLSILLFIVALYQPGMIWLVIYLWWLERRALGYAWKRPLANWRRLSWIIIWLLALSGLIHGDSTHPHLLTTILGLPTQWPSPLHILKNLIAGPVHIFLRGPQLPLSNLATLPLVNVLVSLLCVIGIYFYARHWQAHRTRLLFGIALIGLVLSAIQGPVDLSIIIPIIFVVATAGLSFILNEWLRIFPRNPVARGIGYGLVALTLLFAAVYDTRQYFVAWPHNPTTVSAFQTNNRQG